MTTPLNAHRIACRALRPKSQNSILRIESGDKNVQGTQWRSALLVASGNNLFALIEEAVAQAAQLSGASKPLRDKMLPDSLDWFGWCTWDAFYSSVSAEVRDCCLACIHVYNKMCKCVVITLDAFQNAHTVAFVTFQKGVSSIHLIDPAARRTACLAMQ